VCVCVCVCLSGLDYVMEKKVFTFVASKADISLAVNTTNFVSFSIHATYFHHTNHPQTLDT
jgi:hypothetical protein